MTLPSLYNEKEKKILHEFLYTYFRNFNKREKAEPFYKNFGAPYHQYDLSSKRLNGSEKIKKVEIVKYYTWYNKLKKEITNFDKQTVMTIEIE